MVWHLESQDGRPVARPNPVVAAGHSCQPLPPCRAALYPVRGQVSHVPTTAGFEPAQDRACYDGYLTPAHNGAHCIGASYGRNQTDLAYCADEQEQNRARLQARSCPSSAGLPRWDVSGAQARVGALRQPGSPAGRRARRPVGGAGGS